jgi:exopolysaccharide biosynthesis WecB/TagA/CpsF family protein
MQRDPLLRRAVREATSIGADGASVWLAARLRGERLPARVAGADLAADLVEDAATRGWRVALLGATPDAVATVVKTLTDRGVRVVHHRDGFFSATDEDEVARAIEVSRPDILLIGMGSPRTEHFVVRHGGRMAVPLILGVGGTFDVWAGRTRRIPARLGAAGLEGLWRFAGEPRKRFVSALVHPPWFLGAVAAGRSLPADSGTTPQLPRSAPAFARLARVPPAEVPYRLGQLARRAADLWTARAPPPSGDTDTWHRDPATGARWPEQAAARIAVVGGADPRPLWERARLQDEALSLVRDPADDRALRRVRSFLRGCPPGWGVHWTSAMEAAHRLVSLVWIAEVVPEADLEDAIRTHAEWIMRHPSRHGSANNHRVAELAALAVAGARTGGDPAWWTAAQQELPQVLAAQLHPDGGGVEQSVAYLGQVLDWASLACGAGVRGLGPPLARGTRFLAALTDAGGHLPVLGDDDGGRLLATHDRAEPPADGVTTFPDTGLTVLRDGHRLVVFDHGPLGSGLGAHGHADALSCWIHAGGCPVVVARGTGMYQGDPAQRAFGRGTGSHPTVVVAGADQSVAHEHPFLWRTRANAWCEGVDPGSKTASAAHDGYVGRHGVVHRRTVTMAPGRVTVADRLDGPARHHAAVIWPLAPDLDVEAGGSVLTVSRAGVPVVRVVPPEDFTIRVLRGGPAPGVGWHAVGYGRFVAATAVVCEGRPAPGRVAKTTFVWL